WPASQLTRPPQLRLPRLEFELRGSERRAVLCVLCGISLRPLRLKAWIFEPADNSPKVSGGEVLRKGGRGCKIERALSLDFSRPKRASLCPKTTVILSAFA